MKLTTFTDYSLRVLMYAGLHRERLITIPEIAAAYDISANHLMKVVHFLARQGYLETIRGKGGGIRLAGDPAEVNLGELVRRSESNDNLVECFSPESSHCRLMPACRLKGVLSEAQESFYATLSRYTLADLLVQPQPMRQALAIAVVSQPPGGTG